MSSVFTGKTYFISICFKYVKKFQIKFSLSKTISHLVPFLLQRTNDNYCFLIVKLLNKPTKRKCNFLCRKKLRNNAKFFTQGYQIFGIIDNKRAIFLNDINRKTSTAFSTSYREVSNEENLISVYGSFLLFK